MRYQSLLLVGLACLFSSAAKANDAPAKTSARSGSAHPNIIVIYTDDQG